MSSLIRRQLFGQSRISNLTDNSVPSYFPELLDLQNELVLTDQRKLSCHAMTIKNAFVRTGHQTPSDAMMVLHNWNTE